jgi:hypothetical protein
VATGPFGPMIFATRTGGWIGSACYRVDGLGDRVSHVWGCSAVR